MDKQQKFKKGYHENCQYCGSYLGINMSDNDLNLFCFIICSIIFFSCGISLLYFPLVIFLKFFHINFFNEGFSLMLGFIFVSNYLLFFLICQFKPELLFEKVDYKKKIKIIKKNY